MSALARTAKSRKRAQSRASTSSIHSATTQPNLDGSFGDATTDVYPSQWLGDDHSQPKALAPAPPQMTPEELMLQAASHLQASREFSMDPSMNASMVRSGSFSQHANMSRQSLSADNYSANNSFVDPDSQLMDHDGDGDGDSALGMSGASKPSRSSANNELEMRQLFQANKNRHLQDVAEELHGNERGPNSERTRQVFAMLWYVLRCTRPGCSLSSPCLILTNPGSGSTKSAPRAKALFPGEESTQTMPLAVRRNASPSSTLLALASLSECCSRV